MAAELVGGALLSSLFQTICDRIISPEVVGFFRGKKVNDRLLNKMKSMLVSVNGVLNDAEKKQITNPSIKAWLEKLKEVIYEADELLDEINTEDLQCKVEAGCGSSLRKRLRRTFFYDTSFKTVERRMEKIVDRLEDLVEQKDLLGLEVGAQNTTLQRLPAPLLEESCIFGRDYDKDCIIKLLLSNDINGNKISVIPIVGMGGLGKTTLAQFVYDDYRVREHFDIKAWITVSDDFDFFRITKVLFESVTFQHREIKESHQLQVALKQTLMGKKFLFVLDDVWNENYSVWDVLKSPFESGAPGSKIILTTRSEIVASMMGNCQTYKLQAMSDEDCWKLFAEHAFNDVNLDVHLNLQEIGKEIVRKCKGLPLAVKSLAGILRSVPKSEEDWRRILKSDIWELQENLSSNILSALWLSYHYLPPNLKRCFAYCSIFPKDSVFEKEEIILLWMAEGLLQPEKGKRMEDVGEEYFQDLISRSLFQRSSQDESTITMHDLVHDLAIFVSGEFCIRLEGNNLHRISQKVRHLSYIRTQCDLASNFGDLNSVKNLHTFLPLKFSSSQHFLGKWVPNNLLPRFRSLRVLSLSHYGNLKKLPDSIGSLKHLRYLDLSHTAIYLLPASIGSLYNLQTLLLLNCASLTRLPPKIGRLVNLRHLYNDGTNLKEMPHQMSGLKNLQTLAVFVVGKGRGYSIKELKHFQNLRGKLSVSGLQNVVGTTEVLEANFNDKKHIEELVLAWDADSQNAREVLDKIQPHLNLKKLTIVHYGGNTFPNWLGDPLFNIRSLSLTNCKNCDSLPPLGQLPSLKELSIIGFDLVEKVDYDFYGRDNVKPFCSLEILKFEDMVKWKKWCCAVGGNESEFFPCLKELYIVNCPKLTGYLPEHLPALTELEIIGCPKLQASLPVAPALCQVDLINCDKMVLKNIPPQLHWLTIKGCSTMKTLFEEIDWSKTSLKELIVLNCSSLVRLCKGCLPQTLKAVGITDCKQLELSMRYSYAFLESLSICHSCDSLSFLPLDLFPKLKRLHIENCCNLESLSCSAGCHQVITTLNFLQITSCPKFLFFPEGGFSACELKWLWIEDCENLESLPEQMLSLMPSLQVLYISRCPQLFYFPEGGLPSNLNTLSIMFCEKLIAHHGKWNLQRLPSLEYFNISSNCEELESFPKEELLPSTLVSLNIAGISCLKSLNYKGLQHLSSLKELKIQDCPKLQSIPKGRLPSSLDFIRISNCPLLKKKGLGKSGKNWTGIAQNACIQMDDEVILCDQV